MSIPVGGDHEEAQVGADEVVQAPGGHDVGTRECELPGCKIQFQRERKKRFCSKAHADQAARMRRDGGEAAPADPVTEALVTAQAETVPALLAAAEQLEALRAFLVQAQEGALTRVQQAERERDAALLKAAEAHGIAERAENAQRDAEQRATTAAGEAKRARGIIADIRESSAAEVRRHAEAAALAAGRAQYAETRLATVEDERNAAAIAQDKAVTARQRTQTKLDEALDRTHRLEQRITEITATLQAAKAEAQRETGRADHAEATARAADQVAADLRNDLNRFRTAAEGAAQRQQEAEQELGVAREQNAELRGAITALTVQVEALQAERGREAEARVRAEAELANSVSALAAVQHQMAEGQASQPNDAQ